MESVLNEGMLEMNNKEKKITDGVTDVEDLTNMLNISVKEEPYEDLPYSIENEHILGLGYVGCNICHELFVDRNIFKEHIMKYHGYLSIDNEAEIQKDNDKDKQNVPEEIISEVNHHNVDSSCNTCNQLLNQINLCNINLMEHVKTHASTDLYQCSICKKPSKTKANLTKHMKTHENKVKSCDICKITFVTKTFFKLHQLTHIDNSGNFTSTRIKRFSCDFCGKLFYTNRNLASHKVLHTKEKSFTCSVCSKSFIYQFLLTRHMAIHNETNSCDLCNKQFTHRNELNMHKRVEHFHQKVHKCTVCDRNFIRKTNLTQHARIHRH